MLSEIVVIGNCQAGPLIDLMIDTGKEERGQVIVVHLARPDQADDHIALIKSAKLVLSQPIADSFPIRHLRTSYLAHQVPKTLLLWPNLFYHGVNPHLFYVTDPSTGFRLSGPLDAYHDEYILSCWESGLSSDDCVEKFHGYAALDAKLRRNTSRSQLVQREEVCDVAISDALLPGLAHARSFFTFNHPCSQLLYQIANRLTEICGIANPPSVGSREPLSLIVPPLSEALCQELEMDPPQDQVYGLEVASDGISVPKSRREYSLAELIESSYQAYDAQLEHKGRLQLFRRTPAL